MSWYGVSQRTVSEKQNKAKKQKASRAVKESRFARHRRIAGEIYAEPRSLGGHVRNGLVSLWVARGAGFYGLGWLVTFVVLEVQLFTGELIESSGFVDFVSNQLFEYVLRFGVLSFLNSLLAFIWPVFVLQHLAGYGIVALVAGYFAFERLLRPAVEARLPELAEARALAQKAKTNST